MKGYVNRIIVEASGHECDAELKLDGNRALWFHFFLEEEQPPGEAEYALVYVEDSDPVKLVPGNQVTMDLYLEFVGTFQVIQAAQTRLLQPNLNSPHTILVGQVIAVSDEGYIICRTEVLQEDIYVDEALNEVNVGDFISVDGTLSGVLR